MTPARRSRLGLWAWALYDWANQAYFTVIQTFVFAAYFTRQVAEDATSGSAAWGHAVAAAALSVGVLGPVLGALADGGGRKKPWLAGLAGLGVVATAGLVTVAPGDEVLVALVLVWLATSCFELANVVYNAMLRDVAPEGEVGRWSGWGWALGYAGGLACLLVALLIESQGAAWGLDRDAAGPVRATFLLAAAWVAVFTVPLLLLTPEAGPARPASRRALREGWARLTESLRVVARHRALVRFFVARMLYADGLATVFAFGGVYAAGTFDMDERAVLTFGIGLNVAAGFGAAVLGRIDDVLGPRRTILLSLGALCAATAGILLVRSEAAFWVMGLVIGAFVGPAQASSRSWMAQAAPPELGGRLFGLFALSGKTTSFVGPLLVGWLTAASGSQRVGLTVVVALFLGGTLLMASVPDAATAAERTRRAGEAPGGA